MLHNLEPIFDSRTAEFQNANSGVTVLTDGGEFPVQEPIVLEVFHLLLGHNL